MPLLAVVNSACFCQWRIVVAPLMLNAGGPLAATKKAPDASARGSFCGATAGRPRAYGFGGLGAAGESFTVKP